MEKKTQKMMNIFDLKNIFVKNNFEFGVAFM